MSDSKRLTERREMFRVCRYNIQGREYADLSTNISEGGIFIKNFSPPPVGTAITLTVKLPGEWDNQPMKIVGRVAHINDDPDPYDEGDECGSICRFCRVMQISTNFHSEELNEY